MHKLVKYMLIFIAVLAIGFILLVFYEYFHLPEQSTLWENENIKFAGTLPEAKLITYTADDNRTYTTTAYPGYIYLYTTPYTNPKLIDDALDKGSSIAAARPDAGLYLIKVSEGEEASAVKKFADYDWYVDSMPAYRIVKGSEMIFYDYFSGNTKDCHDDHGDLVELLAQQYGGKTDYVNVDTWNLENSVDLAGHMIDTIKDNPERKVISLSLQSGGSEFSLTELDKSGDCDQCWNVRREQRTYLEAFMQALDIAIKESPQSAENTIVVVIAGNAGVSIDKELQDLRNQYPKAYAKIKVVGASTYSGGIDKNFNHLADNTQPNIIYACGNDVPIYDKDGKLVAKCGGTSFAAPQVTSALDYIWSKNPGLTANQVLQAFDKTLADRNANNVMPQVGCKTSLDFLDAVVIKSKNMYPNSSAYTLTIKRPDKAYGGFRVVPSPLTELGNCSTVCYAIYNHNETVEVSPLDSESVKFTGYQGACSGTESCIINMASDKEVIMRFATDLVYVTVRWQGDGSGTVEGIPTYGEMDCGGTDYRCILPVLKGSDVIGKPLPDDNSVFDSWSGDCYGSGNCVFTADSNKTIMMKFDAKKVAQQPIQTSAGGCAYLCTHNADCNTYSAYHCGTQGALCDSDGKCHCNVITDGFWTQCPCSGSDICIGRYCGVAENGCPNE